MLTIILVTYFVLSLIVGIIIYCACVVASRSDAILHAGQGQAVEGGKRAGGKRVSAKPAPIIPVNVPAVKVATGNPSLRQYQVSSTEVLR